MSGSALAALLEEEFWWALDGELERELAASRLRLSPAVAEALEILSKSAESAPPRRRTEPMERLEVTDTTNRARSGWLAAAFFGLGIPFFVMCASGHLCKCGHLAHSPTLWDRANDVLWIGLFSLSILAAGASLSQSRFWRPFGICVSLLAWTRLLFVGWSLEWEIAFGVLSVVFAFLALTHSSKSESRSRWSRSGLGRSAVLATLLVLGALALLQRCNTRTRF